MKTFPKDLISAVVETEMEMKQASNEERTEMNDDINELAKRTTNRIGKYLYIFTKRKVEPIIRSAFEDIYDSAITDAANQVLSHYNDSQTVVNQMEQAKRSADVIRKLRLL